MNTELKYDLLPTLHGQPIITVCAWCYPNLSILDTRPELSKYLISHGMCRAHFDAMKREFLAMKEAK